MSVERADKYRKEAEECVRHAHRAVDPADKATWLKMAEYWQTLAESIDRKTLTI